MIRTRDGTIQHVKKKVLNIQQYSQIFSNIQDYSAIFTTIQHYSAEHSATPCCAEKWYIRSLRPGTRKRKRKIIKRIIRIITNSAISTYQVSQSCIMTTELERSSQTGRQLNFNVSSPTLVFDKSLNQLKKY